MLKASSPGHLPVCRVVVPSWYFAFFAVQTLAPVVGHIRVIREIRGPVHPPRDYYHAFFFKYLRDFVASW